jgi:hypothetical protein
MAESSSILERHVCALRTLLWKHAASGSPTRSPGLIYTGFPMKRASAIAAALVGLTLPNLYAAHPLDQKGKIVEVQRKSQERLLYYLVNTPITKEEPYYEISVQVGHTRLVGDYIPRHSSETVPDEWVPNAEVAVAVEKHYFYLQRPSGGEMQLVLVKRIVAPAPGKMPDAAPPQHR